MLRSITPTLRRHFKVTYIPKALFAGRTKQQAGTSAGPRWPCEPKLCPKWVSWGLQEHWRESTETEDGKTQKPTANTRCYPQAHSIGRAAPALGKLSRGGMPAGPKQHLQPHGTALHPPFPRQTRPTLPRRGMRCRAEAEQHPSVPLGSATPVTWHRCHISVTFSNVTGCRAPD